MATVVVMETNVVEVMKTTMVVVVVLLKLPLLTVVMIVMAMVVMTIGINLRQPGLPTSRTLANLLLGGGRITSFLTLIHSVCLSPFPM